MQVLENNQLQVGNSNSASTQPQRTPGTRACFIPDLFSKTNLTSLYFDIRESVSKPNSSLSDLRCFKHIPSALFWIYQQWFIGGHDTVIFLGHTNTNNNKADTCEDGRAAASVGVDFISIDSQEDDEMRIKIVHAGEGADLRAVMKMLVCREQ